MELKKTKLTSRRLAAASLAAALTLLSQPLLAAKSLPSKSPVAESLPELGADIGSTSVSGLSSGAYMAGQIEVAHSKDIKGAGIVAGGPYACAETQSSRQVPFWPSAVLQNAQQALNQCMQTTAGTPDPKALVKRAEELAKDGAIDPLTGLADDNVYLFSGNEDQTVTRPVVESSRRVPQGRGRGGEQLDARGKRGWACLHHRAGGSGSASPLRPS